MSTNLRNTPIFIEDDNLVSCRDRIKLVGNNDEGRATTQCIHSRSHAVFILGIKGAGGLVKEDDGCSFKECAGD